MSEKKFTINDYLEVKISQNLVRLCSDCYQALGWVITDTRLGVDMVTLKLERNRKIPNRSSLCELQRTCEDAFIQIERLEKIKMAKPIGGSLGVGLLGTALIAVSIFAITGYLAPLWVILAIPGFSAWGSAYFLYKKFLRESMAKVSPLIERNYDIIYEACEKAEQLLYK
ncbi:hypothetical protein SAMN02745136_01485 [Anaerocolumna jejuensis DSM 15929]|uniref:Uncharacterized protein n=1 Tax=Anaerocolumna jejuensis DSM 15929 TaxID=1121322 RepID=A0A1M6NWA1_9FIRM|nr:hypothetical protein [Anaerocolumna jejuensis]SHJ99976.1 hypothetical protein SAMN02745136_01485 [Anaerocolumna jejuensis DSM 15929]